MAGVNWKTESVKKVVIKATAHARWEVDAHARCEVGVMCQHDWYTDSRISLHSSPRENGKCTYMHYITFTLH